MNKMTWSLLGITIAFLGYELYALFNGKPGDTISEAIWFLNKHPIIPFAFGVLMGHFFWQR